jgi:reactive intermediate/imine deaminase
MKNLLFILIIISPIFGFSQEIQRINSNEHLEKNRPFSQATIVNNIIYLSGQIGTLPNGKLISGGIEAETRQTLINIKTLLNSMGLSMDHVFKCTCMLNDIKDWSKMSEIYATFFKKDKLPARSAFAGSGLAAEAKLEIECMALMSSN